MAEDNTVWLAYTAGRSNGTKAVLLALAMTHHDPASFLAELEKAEQSALALSEGTLLTDDYMSGMREIIDSVRNLLNLRLGTASGRNKP